MLHVSPSSYFDESILNFCRPPHRELLSHACSIVTDWLQVNLAKTEDSMPETELPRETEVLLSFGKNNEVPVYDVFISYSHQNSEFAHKIKDEVLNFHPNWNIFIDVAELKTGVVWQVKLYRSIGKLLDFYYLDFFCILRLQTESL